MKRNENNYIFLFYINTNKFDIFFEFNHLRLFIIIGHNSQRNY